MRMRSGAFTTSTFQLSFLFYYLSTLLSGYIIQLASTNLNLSPNDIDRDSTLILALTMAKSKLKKKNRASRRRTNDRQRRTPANRVPPPTEAAMEPTVESDHEDGGNRDNDSDSETASQKELYFSPLNPVSTDRQKVLRWRLPLRSNTARGFLYLFKSAWSILKTTVDDFVRYLLPRPFHRAMFGPAEKAQLSSFVRQAKVKPYINILCHEIVEWGAREYILQAWVWRVLYDNLFSLDCSDKWRDGPWAAFGIQLQDMKGARRYLLYVQVVYTNPGPHRQSPARRQRIHVYLLLLEAILSRYTPHASRLPHRSRTSQDNTQTEFRGVYRRSKSF